MRDVRDRGDDRSVAGQERHEPLEGGQRVAQMLQHVTEQDDVEAAGLELLLQIERLDVADDHALGVLLGDLRHLRVQLDPGDPVAPLRQHLGHVACGRPHLKDATADPRQQDHLSQALVGIVEVDLEVVVRPAWSHWDSQLGSTWPRGLFNRTTRSASSPIENSCSAAKKMTTDGRPKIQTDALVGCEPQATPRRQPVQRIVEQPLEVARDALVIARRWRHHHGNTLDKFPALLVRPGSGPGAERSDR